MSTRALPRYRFDRDTTYRVTVIDDGGERCEHRLEAYQGWLEGPDGIRHRFGVHRRVRTEVRDDRIKAVIGP